jgi:hypothetical protein
MDFMDTLILIFKACDKNLHKILKLLIQVLIQERQNFTKNGESDLLLNFCGFQDFKIKASLVP